MKYIFTLTITAVLALGFAGCTKSNKVNASTTAGQATACPMAAKEACCGSCGGDAAAKEACCGSCSGDATAKPAATADKADCASSCSGCPMTGKAKPAATADKANCGDKADCGSVCPMTGKAKPAAAADKASSCSSSAKLLKAKPAATSANTKKNCCPSSN